MKRIGLLIALLSITVVSGSPITDAQAGGPSPGDVGITFDLGFTTKAANPPRFTVTNLFYAMGRDLSGGVAGYEFGLTIDPFIIVFSSIIEPVTAINIGTAPTNFIVGTGQCLSGAGNVLLATFTYGVFDAVATDLMICVTPAMPSSFVPAWPGYLECDDTLTPFGVLTDEYGCYGDGCSFLYPTCVVGTGTTSWGSVKSRF